MEAWQGLSKDIEELVAHHPDIINQKDIPDSWLTPPEFTSVLIRFDGSPAHETFAIERTVTQSSWRMDEPLAFTFCKTARKPYDRVVTAALILAKHHLGADITISSDGDPDDWTAGYELTKPIFVDGRVAKAAMKATMKDLTVAKAAMKATMKDLTSE